MNTVVCRASRRERAGQTPEAEPACAFTSESRVYVAGHDPGSALEVRVLRADGDAELSPGGRIAEGSRVYLPDGPFLVRPGKGVELRIERVPDWPLRRPLVVTPRDVVGRADAPEPRRAFRRAVRDVAGYLQRVQLWPRVEALLRLALLADARLVEIGRRGGPVVAEVRLRLPAVTGGGAGRAAAAPR